MFKLKKEQNKLVKDFILLTLLLICGGLIMGAVFYHSSYFSNEGHFVSQPIAFSHRLHVQEIGLECQFCHVQASTKSTMEMPTTETCFGCHREVLKSSDYLKPVRRAHRSGKAVPWNRVNNLPDHVYFHHGKHVEAGINCSKCHGDVQSMPLISPKKMSMQWCLDCHNNANAPLSERLQLKDCYTCHR